MAIIDLLKRAKAQWHGFRNESWAAVERAAEGIKVYPDPSQFTVRREPKATRFALRPELGNTSEHHPFEVTLNADDQGDFDGTATVHPGNEAAPGDTSDASVPGGNDDPATSIAAIQPHLLFGELLDAAVEVTAAAGQKIWIEAFWILKFEDLGRHDPVSTDPYWNDVFLWEHIGSFIQVGDDWPDPDINWSMGTAVLPVRIAEIIDNGGSAPPTVTQYLFSDCRFTFPFLKDRTLLPPPKPAADPEDPEPPTEAEFDVGTEQTLDIVGNVFTTASGECLVLRETKERLKWTDLDIAINNDQTTISDINFDPTLPSEDVGGWAFKPKG